jgi:hypothetical protein
VIGPFTVGTATVDGLRVVGGEVAAVPLGAEATVVVAPDPLGAAFGADGVDEHATTSQPASANITARVAAPLDLCIVCLRRVRASRGGGLSSPLVTRRRHA